MYYKKENKKIFKIKELATMEKKYNSFVWKSDTDKSVCIRAVFDHYSTDYNVYLKKEIETAYYEVMIYIGNSVVIFPGILISGDIEKGYAEFRHRDKNATDSIKLRLTPDSINFFFVRKISNIK